MTNPALHPAFGQYDNSLRTDQFDAEQAYSYRSQQHLIGINRSTKGGWVRALPSAARYTGLDPDQVGIQSDSQDR